MVVAATGFAAIPRYLAEALPDAAIDMVDPALLEHSLESATALVPSGAYGRLMRLTC